MMKQMNLTLTCSNAKEGERKVLLLNASEEVISVISWCKAVNLLFSGKAKKPYNHEHYHEIKTTSGVYQLPTAIVLIQYINIPYRDCPLNRKNILKRDQYKCQYCAKSLRGDYSIDHIVPKSRGGKNSWSNLVACCKKCNTKKANKPLKDTNMKLLREPKKPSRDFIHIVGIDTNTNESWSRWIEIKGDINESI